MDGWSSRDWKRQRRERERDREKRKRRESKKTKIEEKETEEKKSENSRKRIRARQQGYRPEKGGRKPAPSPNLCVSAEKCRGSVCHDRSYHPKRPLTIPYEQKPKPPAAPLEDFSLLCNPSPPLPQYYFSSPCKLSCSEPQRTLLSVELRSSSIFFNFPHVFHDFPSFTFVFFKHFSCRSSTFLRFPPP